MKINSQDFISIASAVAIVASVLGGGAWMHADLKSDIAENREAIKDVRTELKADIAENREAIKDVRTELKADIAENRKAINENGKAIARISETIEGIKETLTSTVERLDLVEAKQDNHSGRIIRLETKLETRRPGHRSSQ